MGKNSKEGKSVKLLFPPGVLPNFSHIGLNSQLIHIKLIENVKCQ